SVRQRVPERRQLQNCSFAIRAGIPASPGQLCRRARIDRRLLPSRHQAAVQGNSPHEPGIPAGRFTRRALVVKYKNTELCADAPGGSTCREQEMIRVLALLPVIVGLSPIVHAAGPAGWAAHPVGTWVKQSPREGAPAPRLQYEGSGAWAPAQRLWIHFAGHD